METRFDLVRSLSGNTANTNEADFKKKINELGADLLLSLKKDLFILRENLTTTIASFRFHRKQRAIKNSFYQDLKKHFALVSDDAPLTRIERDKCHAIDTLVVEIDHCMEQIESQVKKDVEESKRLESTIDGLANDLLAKSNRFKSDMIDVLQLIAEDYRALLVAKKIWQENFPQFMDKFGCVVWISAAEPPYSLVKEKGLGVNFGRDLRKNGMLPKVECEIKAIKALPLDSIESMINRIIAECYKDDDSYEVMELIKKRFDVFKERYGEFFLLSDHLSFTRFRKLEFKFTKKEKEMVEMPIQIHKAALAEFKAGHPRIAADLWQQVDSLQQRCADVTSATKHDMKKIKKIFLNSSKKIERSFSEQHEGFVSHVSCIGTMNIEANRMRLGIDALVGEINEGYKKAIHCATNGNIEEYKEAMARCDGCCREAHEKKQDLERMLVSLKVSLDSLRQKMDLNQKLISATAQEKNDSDFSQLSEEYKKNHAKYLEVANELQGVAPLPEAAKRYGEIYLDCSLILAQSTQAAHDFQAVKKSLKKIKQSYASSIDALQKNDRSKSEEMRMQLVEDVKQTSAEFYRVHAKLIAASERVQLVVEKITEAEKIFSSDLHRQHHYYFIDVRSRVVDCEKQAKVQLETMQQISQLPGALEDNLSIAGLGLEVDAVMREIRRSGERVLFLLAHMYEDKVHAIQMAMARVVSKSFSDAIRAKWQEIELITSKNAERLKELERRKHELEAKLAQIKTKHPDILMQKSQQHVEMLGTRLQDLQHFLARPTEKMAEAKALPEELDVVLQRITSEKTAAMQLRELLLKTILGHLDLWKVSRWGGGVDFYYAGKNHTIPHGVFALLTSLLTTRDHNTLINELTNIVKDKIGLSQSSWRYRLFGIRDDKTEKLYQAIRKHVTSLSSTTLVPLQDAMQAIQGVNLDEKQWLRQEQKIAQPAERKHQDTLELAPTSLLS